ncbi:hypothetical protein KAM479_05250 [Aeromonas caviae]|nr:hypothetical protein KAM497c_30130 [Aeromonas caviae]GKR68604.1 hypothetical protein KAM479_05250 [Aeromonas caviae]
MTMSSKIYFNTRRFSPSKLLLGLGTRLHHVLAPTHAKRTASKLLLIPIGLNIRSVLSNLGYKVTSPAPHRQ